MPKYIIERNIPGASELSQADLSGIAEKSNSIIKQIGPEIQWIESYVAGDKFYCVYISPNEEKIYEHAKMGEFPANSVVKVSSIIDPTTAEK